MPKYFSGEIKLPHTPLSIKASEVSLNVIKKVFITNNELSVSIIHDGLQANSLGYLAHIKKIDGGFLISNIVGEPELAAANIESLCAILNHISGHEYNKEIQKIFQKNRNNIGASNAPPFFCTY